MKLAYSLFIVFLLSVVYFQYVNTSVAYYSYMKLVENGTVYECDPLDTKNIVFDTNRFCCNENLQCMKVNFKSSEEYNYDNNFNYQNLNITIGQETYCFPKHYYAIYLNQTTHLFTGIKLETDMYFGISKSSNSFENVYDVIMNICQTTRGTN
eukprot:TRINITY_DN14307_c0_g1_i1.p1 TRINITY_DN14307_c0_g1~~TRINITY_DN14307_c0_g1_i1.p1  ORF type:complete len:153 (+),score=14.68 TRINITY_DN14307_c0_g1_i1:53-511(+)